MNDEKFRKKLNKRLGRNYLTNKDIINSIILNLNPKPSQSIVEIGPGFGALTKPVIKLVNKITVIELDCNSISYLSKFSSFKSKLDIIACDVMKVDFELLFSKFNQKMRIFGNLPYRISTSIILNLIKKKILFLI